MLDYETMRCNLKLKQSINRQIDVKFVWVITMLTFHDFQNVHCLNDPLHKGRDINPLNSQLTSLCTCFVLSDLMISLDQKKHCASIFIDLPKTLQYSRLMFIWDQRVVKAQVGFFFKSLKHHLYSDSLPCIDNINWSSLWGKPVWKRNREYDIFIWLFWCMMPTMFVVITVFYPSVTETKKWQGAKGWDSFC